MALIGNPNPDRDAVHALVIGVGAYPYFAGLDPELDPNLESVGALEPLTSPPRSALRFAQWLMNPAAGVQLAKPLGSIELLVSPHPNDDPATLCAEFPELGIIRLEAATIGTIRARYTEWKVRCLQDPNNVAVFFFSGHGLEKQEHFLLAEDFGADVGNPWLGAVAFDTTRQAFGTHGPRTQCFFVDACRKVTSGMLKRRLPENPLEILDDTKTPECEHELTMKAAAHNESAFGPTGKPSYFTQALVAGLDGGAAKREAGKWVVKTTGFADTICDLLTAVKASEGYKQRCAVYNTAPAVLSEISKAPDVALTVTCNPDAANQPAQIRCKPLGGGNSPPVCGAAPLRETVAAGIYEYQADFPPNTFTSDPDHFTATPPSFKAIVECR